MDKLADNRLIMSMYTSFDPIYCRRCVTSTGQTVISKSMENIQLRLSRVLRMTVMLRGSFPLLTK